MSLSASMPRVDTKSPLSPLILGLAGVSPKTMVSFVRMSSADKMRLLADSSDERGREILTKVRAYQNRNTNLGAIPLVA